MDICMGSRRRQIHLLGIKKVRVRKELEMACLKEKEMRRKLTDKRNRLKYEELTPEQEDRLERLIPKHQEHLNKQQAKCAEMEKEFAKVNGRLLSLIKGYNERMGKLLKNYEQSSTDYYGFSSDRRKKDWTIVEEENGFINIIPDQNQ